MLSGFGLSSWTLCLGSWSVVIRKKQVADWIVYLFLFCGRGLALSKFGFFRSPGDPFRSLPQGSVGVWVRYVYEGCGAEICAFALKLRWRR